MNTQEQNVTRIAHMDSRRDRQKTLISGHRDIRGAEVGSPPKW